MGDTRSKDARGDVVPPDTCPICYYRHIGKCEEDDVFDTPMLYEAETNHTLGTILDKIKGE